MKNRYRCAFLHLIFPLIEYFASDYNFKGKFERSGGCES
ncbi:hypothetical protein LEP1GSC058_1791 [Leptospira fainei serovar Hurstbridge str. BUT 6]|uniref:Uncharacterized protein n=1 Tax=Leptospira fainei serovar Hurstbridge str. BUT 6 TaxID=1193011 RepID=S3V1Z6_9LEPT|nr:hypothetical protein LEP1GSC058_1791 [Leptospira fainei serovar Hurstbridge str. BUT 6]